MSVASSPRLPLAAYASARDAPRRSAARRMASASRALRGAARWLCAWRAWRAGTRARGSRTPPPPPRRRGRLSPTRRQRKHAGAALLAGGAGGDSGGRRRRRGVRGWIEADRRRAARREQRREVELGGARHQHAVLVLHPRRADADVAFEARERRARGEEQLAVPARELAGVAEVRDSQVSQSRALAHQLEQLAALDAATAGDVQAD